MILNLVVLGFILSLDNFRSSLTLGLIRFRWRHAALIALVFGFFDAIAPLAGIILGHYASQQIGGPVSDVVGPLVLGLFGVYLIVQFLRGRESGGETDYRFIVFGLPIPLSLDNVVAGVGLGLVGVSPVVPAVLFGSITAVMSFIGLEIGKRIAHIIPSRIRWELVAGIALIIESIVFGLGLLG